MTGSPERSIRSMALPIEGMTCASCVLRVEKVFKRVDGVADAAKRVLFLLTTPVIFLSGRRFFRGFWTAVRHLAADMNTLVAVGTTAAYLSSTVAVLFPELLGMAGRMPEVYFDPAATIITLILLGKMLEGSAKQHASDAIRRLLGLQLKKPSVF